MTYLLRKGSLRYRSSLRCHVTHIILGVQA